MESLLTSLQHSSLAQHMASSVAWLGMMSAIHLVGYALLMGAMLVSNLRLAGWLFTDRPVREVTDPAARALAAGLTISVVTGFLMFSTRAVEASGNSIFQLKMLLLVGSAVCQFILQPGVVRREPTSPASQRAVGILGLLLWWAVALAGCAFILLE